MQTYSQKRLIPLVSNQKCGWRRGRRYQQSWHIEYIYARWGLKAKKLIVKIVVDSYI